MSTKKKASTKSTKEKVSKKVSAEEIKPTEETSSEEAAEVVAEEKAEALKEAAEPAPTEVVSEASTESLFSEEAVEIKEIIERAPEESRENKEKKSGGKDGATERKGSVLKGIAAFFALLCSPFVAVWKGAQKGARYFIVVATLLCVVLAAGVIVLSGKLTDTQKELKSVQTMSVGLQADLEDALDEVAQKDLLLFAQPNPSMAESVRATPIPTPSPTPTPIPSPTPVPPKYVVCVDAGHGDWDGGAGYYEQREDGKWYRIRNEKDDNLRMAKWFAEALEAYGVKVILTRDTDVFLTLDERTDIANEAKADALISFHRNSYDGNSNVKGVEFWIHSSKPEGARILAYDMLAAIMEVGGMQSRGVKWGSMSSTKEDYAINREAEMTSMIVELGFISSETDNEAYDTYGEQYAEKMAEAVFEWLEEEEAEKQKVATEEE